jgi:type IV secretory pathway VirB2 component (pilin)
MAQGSPFDTGLNAIQALFTGTIAKVASLVAIVIGGYGFAHGEPGAKKALAGVAAGTGIATFHPGAAQNITDIWEFIVEDNPLAARRVREDILDAVRKLVPFCA